MANASPPASRWARAILSACATALVAIAGTVLIGWWVREPRLVYIPPGFPAMEAPTAFLLLASGLALLLSGSGRTRLGAAAGVAGAVLAGIQWAGDLAPLDLGLGVARLLAGAPPPESGLVPRLTRPETAFALLFVCALQAACSLGLAGARRLITSAGGAAVGALGLSTLGAYAIGLDHVVQTERTLPLPTAACLLLLGCALSAWARTFESVQAQEQEPLGPWPLLAGAALLVPWVLVWGQMRDHELEAIERARGHEVDFVAGVIDMAVEQPVSSLERMETRFAEGIYPARGNWSSDARQLLAHQPWRALAVIDPASGELWSEPASTDPSLAEPLGLRGRTLPAAPRVQASAKGGLLTLKLPVRTPEGPRLLLGVLSLSDALAPMVSHLSADRGLRISLANTPVLQLGAAIPPGSSLEEREIRLVDSHLRLEVYTPSASLDTLGAAADKAVLLLGVPGSVLVAIALQLAATARRRRLAATEANEALVAQTRVLQRVEVRLALALEAAGIGAWTVLVPEDRTLLDDRAGEILGISGRSIPRAAAFGKIHPDDAVRVRGESERSLRARTPLLISYRLLRRDDDLRHVVVAGAFLYDDAGEAIEICGVVFDVTERREVEEALRESEARVRRVIEQAPFPIAIHAEDGTAVLINDAWCSRSGYERAEIATLEAWAERAGGNRAEEICAQARELYAKDEPMYLGLAAVATKSGEERIWELRFAPVGQLPDGRRIFVTMAADVTERDLARDLARSNHELEQFAYVASHDLQEPLRMVASYVQLLEQRYKGKLDETADKYIHYAVDGATRMRGLINDLLDYSRAGRGEVPDTPVSAAELLDDVQRNLRMRIEEAQAQLTCDALPDLRGNRSELTLIFQNLIDNALKYRGQAPVRVHVGCDGAEEPGRARFSVRDNGIGFEPQHAERIFRPFQRLHDRSQYSGNGIGLALVQRIVGRYGGRVWAESTPGQGSTFRFTLPIAARKE